MFDYKQAIVLRADLGLGKGKLVAQGAHASLNAYMKAEGEAKIVWDKFGMKKIVLKVQSEKELMQYFTYCDDAGLKPALIRDAGHTQIPSGTVTCFGVGPAEEKKIDGILGELKLL